MKQAFQTPDLVGAFIHVNSIDMQSPETHSSVLQKGENNLHGTENIQ